MIRSVKLCLVLFSFTIAALAQTDRGELNIKPDTKLLDGTPVKRCATMEHDAWRRKMHPELGTLEDFERWMQQAIQKFKQDLATSKVQVASYTIPVIVHVIHDGEPVGTGYNISAEQIISQIDRLNEDFQFLNSDTNEIPSVFRPVAADCQIEFCLVEVDPLGNPLAEPGIDRVNRNLYGWVVPPYTINYIDQVIKPATIWDPSKYFNIWVTEIDGGVLGYATFPAGTSLPGLGAGGGPTDDGVVIGYNFFGDITRVVTPQLLAGAPYNRGRTATHEVGHWLGLRHIWGDGNCLTDYCNDTPTADQPHYGCPSHPLHVDNCGAGTSPNGEMFMNYMDYVNDNCMNMFTLDQRFRMWTALTQGTYRSTLTSSAAIRCRIPEISFVRPSTLQIEASTSGTIDCRGYVDVKIPIRIEWGPQADVSAILNVIGGTATLGVDYDIITNSVTFTAGGGTQIKYFVIRIYDEASIENDETIIIDFTISDVSLASYGTNTTHTLTIIDNDKEFVFKEPLFYEDFEGSTEGWTFNARFNGTPTGINRWTLMSVSALYGSRSAFVSEDGTYNNYKVNDDSDYLLISPQIDATGYNNVHLSFHYVCNGEQWNGTLYDYGDLYYSLDGINYTLIDGGNTPATNPFYNVTTDTRYYKDLSGMVANSTFYLAWRWRNDNSAGNNPAFTIDSVFVWSYTNEIPVETALNSTDTEYLGPGDSAYFVNHSTGKLMAKIVNQSNTHDYGCVTVTIDRAGTGGVDFQVVGKPATEKTFLVTPTNNNPSGTYDIVLYYTEAEIAGWETASGDVRTNLQVFKSGGPIKNVSPTNPNANGPTNEYANTTNRRDYYITPDHGWRGNFSTGFSGFALCNGCIDVTPAPIVYFDAKLINRKDALLEWEFAGKAPKRFHIERSFDRRNFEEIGFVLVKDNGKSMNQYLDKDVIRFGKEVIYYRIYALYEDGSKEYTNIEAVKIPIMLANSVAVYPNPAKDYITLVINSEEASITIVEIYDAFGRLIKKEEFNVSTGEFYKNINVSDLSSGNYLIRITNNSLTRSIKLVKQ